jgi:hypothetical protein
MEVEFLPLHQPTLPCLHAFLRLRFGIYQATSVKAPAVTPTSWLRSSEAAVLLFR